MFSDRDQFCSFWDQFSSFAYLIRLEDHFCAGITFAAIQMQRQSAIARQTELKLPESSGPENQNYRASWLIIGNLSETDVAAERRRSIGKSPFN